jgi:carbapenam-3-carboxylate synthase
MDAASVLDWSRSAFARSCGLLATPAEVVFWTDEMATCPLFYAFLPSGAPVFASEAKLLLPFLGAGARLADFGERPLPAIGGTVFAGVFAVPPGTVLRMVRGREWELGAGSRYFDLPPRPWITDLDEGVSAVAAALEGAVDRAVAGLDEVAVSLSGGVDSSGVAALARRQVRTMRSFTVGTRYGDEFEGARRVADLLRTEHRELMMTAEDLGELLPWMIWRFETWDRVTLQIAAPVAFLYQRLKASAPVFLTGYGADLVFAGVADTRLAEADLEASILEQVRLTVPTNEMSPALPGSFGVTVRYPYWSPAVLNAGLALRGRLKLRDGEVKYVLRRALESVLPADVAWRPKLGIHEGSAMHRLFAEVLGEADPKAQARRLRELAEGLFAADPSRSQPDPNWREEPCGYY